MKKTLITMGWAFAAMLLLAACHGVNQGEQVNIAPDQAPQMSAGATGNGDATGDGTKTEDATFKAIKTMIVTRYEYPETKIQNMNFVFKDDGRLGTINIRKTVDKDDAGGQDMNFEYDDQGRLKSLMHTIVPSPQPGKYKPSGDMGSKYTYDAQGRELSIELYDETQKLFGTWAYTYNDTGAGIEKNGVFTYNLPTPPRLKSKALFDLNGRLSKIAFSVDVAAPNIKFEREFFYTPEGAIKGITEKQYDTVTFKLVFTRVIEIAYKSLGVPEKLSASVVDLNNKTSLYSYTVKGYDEDLVAQAVEGVSFDNGVIYKPAEDMQATYQSLKVQPIVDVGILLNNERKSILEFASSLLVFANQPEILLGKM